MSPDNRPGAPNAARGIVIVVVAGLIGVFLLGRGGTTGLVKSSSNGATKSTTTLVANVPTIAPGTTTTAPPTTNPPADVDVSIFNGTGGAVESAAGNAQAKLSPLGYSKVSINDTTATEASAVYFTEGHQGNAEAIAAALGIATDAVKPVADASNLPSIAEGVSVVVIIGKDVVSSTK